MRDSSDTRPTLAVCIATHERPQLVRRVLHCLAAQTRQPDEVVICDSSSGEQTAMAVEDCRRSFNASSIRYVRSGRAALPWQRWQAFKQTSADVILFLDDDIRLMPSALATLVRVYSRESTRVAGVGIMIGFENGWEWRRSASSLRERLLGTSGNAPGTITPGGISVSPAGLTPREVHRVAWLCGGAMSFCRESLERAGELSGLHKLYELRIGSAEDCVLSVAVSQANCGQLLMITDSLAFHPELQHAIRNADSHDGWRKGLRETLGRAHTMRWLAKTESSLRRDWTCIVMLELSRAGIALLRRPWDAAAWARLAGGVYGMAVSIRSWRVLPMDPHLPLQLDTLRGVTQ